MKSKKHADLRALAHLSPPLHEILLLASRTVSEQLAASDLPHTYKALIEYIAQNGTEGDLNLTPLAEQALTVFDQIGYIENLRNKESLDDFGGACVGLGVMLRDFEQASRGKSIGRTHKLAKNFYTAAQKAGARPAAKEVHEYLSAKLGSQFSTSITSFVPTYSRWVKRWARE